LRWKYCLEILTHDNNKIGLQIVLKTDSVQQWDGENVLVDTKYNMDVIQLGFISSASL